MTPTKSVHVFVKFAETVIVCLISMTTVRLYQTRTRATLMTMGKVFNYILVLGIHFEMYWFECNCMQLRH